MPLKSKIISIQILGLHEKDSPKEMDYRMGITTFVGRNHHFYFMWDTLLLCLQINLWEKF